MSQKNVEIVQRVFEAAAQHDAEAIFDLYGSDVEFDTSRSPLPSLIGGRHVYRGHEGLLAFFRERSDALTDIRDDNEELIDAGERVISVSTVRGTGRTSGIEVVTGMAAVWTIIGGKVDGVAWFATRAEALEAAGLSDG